jgi:hypothetical protein
MRSPHHLLEKMALHFRQWRVLGVSARGRSVKATELDALELFMGVSLIGIANWADDSDFMATGVLKSP